MNKDDCTWTCDGKCRICPYPGALCKEHISIEPEAVSHRREDDAPFMDHVLQSEIMKHLGG